MEAIKNGEVARSLKLEHDTAAQSVIACEITTDQGGAIKVSCCVPNHAGVGVAPLRSAGETVQHGLVAVRINLEQSSTAGRLRGVTTTIITTIVCCAVEVARLIADQTGRK